MGISISVYTKIEIGLSDLIAATAHALDITPATQMLHDRGFSDILENVSVYAEDTTSSADIPEATEDFDVTCMMVDISRLPRSPVGTAAIYNRDNGHTQDGNEFTIHSDIGLRSVHSKISFGGTG